MDSIITTNLKDITLSSQFLTLLTPNGELEIDIKQLLKEPVNSDSAYFNATTVAKMYNKDLSNFTRTEGYKKYIEMLNRDYHGIKMERKVRGRHHSGTWFHSKMFLKFVSWVDVEFEYGMHRFLEQLIIHSNEIKIERDNTKILYKDLSRIIDTIYIPAQESENSKKFAYSNIAGLVNIKVLGSLATKYAKDNSIEVEKGKSVRDYLEKDKLEQIKEVERVVAGIIEFGNITDYEEIKERLNK